MKVVIFAALLAASVTHRQRSLGQLLAPAVRRVVRGRRTASRTGGLLPWMLETHDSAQACLGMADLYLVQGLDLLRAGDFQRLEILNGI
jgi:hypothetical protein